MILKFHGTPLARGQGVCDIDRVYRERRGLTPFFNFFFLSYSLLRPIDMTKSMPLASGVPWNVKIFESTLHCIVTDVWHDNVKWGASSRC